MTITATNRAASTREERVYRNLSKKCARSEGRFHMFEELSKMKIGLRNIEEFLLREGEKSKKGELKFNSKIRNDKEEREIVGLMMRRKKREISDT